MGTVLVVQDSRTTRTVPIDPHLCAIIVPCEDDYTDFKYRKENGRIGSARHWK